MAGVAQMEELTEFDLLRAKRVFRLAQINGMTSSRMIQSQTKTLMMNLKTFYVKETKNLRMKTKASVKAREAFTTASNMITMLLKITMMLITDVSDKDSLRKGDDQISSEDEVFVVESAVYGDNDRVGMYDTRGDGDESIEEVAGF